jgi:hypothetical protein
MIGGYALLVVGLVRWWRAGRSEPSPYARSGLQALTRRQGRELSAELYGSKPAPPGDLLVLRHPALMYVRGRHLTPALAGMALFFAGGPLSSSGAGSFSPCSRSCYSRPPRCT